MNRSILLLALFVGLAVAISPARFMERRRRVWGAPAMCPIAGKAATDAEVLASLPAVTSLAAGPLYTAGNSPLDGSALAGKAPFQNKIDGFLWAPKLAAGAIASQAAGKDICTKGAAAPGPLCCPTRTAGFVLGNAATGKIGKNQAKGCGGAPVFGQARLFMPQITNAAAFTAWAAVKFPGRSGVIAAVKPVALAKLVDIPAQGEIWANKIYAQMCAVVAAGGAPFPPVAGKTELYVCAPGANPPVAANAQYILDGHHRAYAYHLYNTAGFAPAIVNVDVDLVDVDCVDLLVMLGNLIDWGAATHDPSPATLLAGAVPCPYPCPHAASGTQFTGMLELEARFGTTAHATVEAARSHYVSETSKRLAETGMALKEGDEGLARIFDLKHASTLGWTE